MTPFIQACVNIVTLQAHEYAKLTSKTDEQHMRRMISVTIRNLTDHPEFGISWSRAAWDKATELGIPHAKMTYATQPRWDKGRLLFAYEHMVPVKSLLWAVIKEPSRTTEILASARIVLITRAENDELNRLGYAHTRPDPEVCYKHAKIEVLPR